MAWFTSVHLSQVLFLTSTDAAFRYHEAQLSGPQMRYVAFPGLSEVEAGVRANAFVARAVALQWRACEADSVSAVLKRGTVSQKLFAACTEVRAPFIRFSPPEHSPARCSTTCPSSS